MYWREEKLFNDMCKSVNGHLESYLLHLADELVPFGDKAEYDRVIKQETKRLLSECAEYAETNGMVNHTHGLIDVDAVIKKMEAEFQEWLLSGVRDWDIEDLTEFIKDKKPEVCEYVTAAYALKHVGLDDASPAVRDKLQIFLYNHQYSVPNINTDKVLNTAWGMYAQMMTNHHQFEMQCFEKEARRCLPWRQK